MKKNTKKIGCSISNPPPRGEDENFSFNFSAGYTVANPEQHNAKLETADRHHPRPPRVLEHLVQHSRPTSLLPYHQLWKDEKKQQREQQAKVRPLRQRVSLTKYKKMRQHTNYFPSPFPTPPKPAPFSREEAENILVAAVENHPDVLPIFVGHPDREGDMQQIRQSTHVTAPDPLLPPKLTLQEGADYLGKRPADFKITVPFSEASGPSVVDPEDKLLFDWWNNRQIVRKKRRDEERISMLVSGPLKQAVRELLTRMESQCIQEYAPSRTNGAIAVVSPNTKQESLTLRFDASTSSSRSGGRGATRSGSTASQSYEGGSDGNRPGTRRGVVFPLHAIEGMFRQVRAHLHETVVNLLEAYYLGKEGSLAVMGGATSNGPPPSSTPTRPSPSSPGPVLQGEEAANGTFSSFSSFQDSKKPSLLPIHAGGGRPSSDSISQLRARQRSRAPSRSGPILGTATLLRKASMAEQVDEKYLALILESEKELAAQVREDFLVPSCASLPPERIFAPCLTMETATSVAVLWKILFQACPVIPGMSFGLHLYESYILPHLYESFSSYASVTPTLGGISEQVMQLADLPLRLETYQVASKVYDQCKADTKYVEYALKHLTLRGWRRDVILTREREAHLQCVVRFIQRLRRQRTLRTFFSAWRFEGRNSSNMKYLSSIQQKYQALLNGTDVLREINLMISPELVNAFSEESKAKTRILANRLAETAFHVKTVPSSQKKQTDSHEHRVSLSVGKAAAPPSDGERSALQQEESLLTPPQPLHQDLLLPVVVGAEEKRKRLAKRRPPSSVVDEEKGMREDGMQDGTTLPHPAAALRRAPRPISRCSSRSASRNSRTPSSAASSGRESAREVPTLAVEGGRQGLVLVMDTTTPKERKEPPASAVRDCKGILKKTVAPSGPSTHSGRRRGKETSNGETSPITPRSSRDSRPFFSITEPTAEQQETEATSAEVTSSITSFAPIEDIDSLGEGSPHIHDLQLKAGNTFEGMLVRLQKMEEVCQYLRSEIGVQSKMLRRVEQERDAVRERNKQLEEELLRVTEERLLASNLVQEKQFLLQEKDRRLMQLKSRLRAHRNRPWQRVVMRVVGGVCEASTFQSEAMDERRVRRDQKPDAPESFPAAVTRGVNWRDTPTEDEDDLEQQEHTSTRQQEEEQLFGKLAPLVLSSTSSLPDATLILRDWANACLDDLEGLDDLKGGALSVRFTTFSEEARNGILISRLLFYLALPRYLQRTARREDEKGGAPDHEFLSGTNYPDRRRQLLRKQNVQLDAPFPVFSECFGDLLTMRPSERMTLLLQFASELISGSDTVANDTVEHQRQSLYRAISSMTDLSLPPPSGRIELQEVIAPHGLALGERASVVTFMALLYIRFAHPFNHKCKQSAEMEKAAILHLLSGGVHRYTPGVAGPHKGGPSGAGGEDREAGGTIPPIGVEEEIIMQLEDEDKSPWQLFKERCLPIFGSAAHPFLLRGNFWPSDAFDSPQLCQLLGQLGLSLHHSLELHRWHILMCCLVPVMTYSGISRGVFTGPRASPLALRVGLEGEGQWSVPLRCTAFLKMYQRRVKIMYQEWMAGRLTKEDLMGDSKGGALTPPPFPSPPPAPPPSLVPPISSDEDAPSFPRLSNKEVGEREGKAEKGWSTPIIDVESTEVTSSLFSSPLVIPSWKNPLAMDTDRGSPFGSLPSPPPPPLLTSSSGGSSVPRGVAPGQGYGVSDMSEGRVSNVLLEREEQRLLDAIQFTSQDLLTLFLRRSTLSAELALPTLHLSGWRLLCVDLKLLSSVPEEDDLVPLSYDVASKIFFDAVMSLNEVARSVTDTVSTSKLSSLTLSAHSAGVFGTSDGELQSTGATNLPSQSFRPRAQTIFAKVAYGKPSTDPLAKRGSVVAPSNTYAISPIPPVSEEMTFTAFVMAMVMLANELFPCLVGDEGDPYAGDEDVGGGSAGVLEGSEQRFRTLPSSAMGIEREGTVSRTSQKTSTKKWTSSTLNAPSDVTPRDKRRPSGSLSLNSSSDFKLEREKPTGTPVSLGGSSHGIKTSGGKWSREPLVPSPPRMSSGSFAHAKGRGVSPDGIGGRKPFASPEQLLFKAEERGKSTRRRPVRLLGESLERLMLHYIPNVAGEILNDESQAVIHRLTMGAATQEVLARFSPAIILVFDAYSKDVYGAAGMEKDDLLQLLRDAMLTSTEISSFLIFEIFQHCCVTRHQCEEEALAKRREIDGKPRDGRRHNPRSVIIIDNRDRRGRSPIGAGGANERGGSGQSSGAATAVRREVDVLVYEGFIRFLCVLCHIKQPNPLIPFSLRLDTFLRRSVLRPLCSHVENLAPVLNTFKAIPTNAFRVRSSISAYGTGKGKNAIEKADSQGSFKGATLSVTDGV